MPVLGVCRGMQMLNVALGGTLIQHLPDVVGHDDHRHTPGTFGDHDVRLEPGSLAARVDRRRADGGQVPPPPGRSTGSARASWRRAGREPDEVVEAIELEGRRFALGVLWHPEEDERSRVIASLVAAADERLGASAMSLEVIEPATEQVMAEIPRAGAEEVDAAVDARQAGVSGVAGRHPGGPRRADPAPRRRPRGRGRGPRDPRGAQRRQADRRRPRRDGDGRCDLPLLRRGARAPARQDDPRRRRRRHDLPRAARRRRPHRPVELPAGDRLLEGCSGAGRGQHDRAEARRADPAHRAGARADRRRGRHPGGRPQRRAPGPAASAATGSSSTPTSPRSPSRGRPRSAARSPPAPRRRSSGSRWSSAASRPT